jgi:hypothetical protein
MSAQNRPQLLLGRGQFIVVNELSDSNSGWDLSEDSGDEYENNHSECDCPPKRKIALYSASDH